MGGNLLHTWLYSCSSHSYLRHGKQRKAWSVYQKGTSHINYTEHPMMKYHESFKIANRMLKQESDKRAQLQFWLHISE